MAGIEAFFSLSIALRFYEKIVWAKDGFVPIGSSVSVNQCFLLALFMLVTGSILLRVLVYTIPRAYRVLRIEPNI